MKHRTSPLWLLSGIVLAFAANAAEKPANPTEQPSTGASNDVKVAIDPGTGKFRPLTAAETKALADKANAMAKRSNSQWDKAPKTAAEARATLRTRADGTASMRVPTDAMSSLTASRDAVGKLHFSEGDAHPAQAVQAEVSE